MQLVGGLFAFCFAWDLGRYLVAAGVAFGLVWLVTRKRWQKKDLRREIRYSLSTAVVFALVGTCLKLGARFGVFRLYEGVATRDWLYFAFSVVAMIVVQDTYFYWTHRAMHQPRFFKRVHRVHHMSHDPSPWAAYAFAPAEAFVQAAYVPLVTLVLPIHELALFAFLGFMITRNVFGHLGIELLPKKFATSPLTQWSTTTTHHAMHHRRSDANYGLYFTFWDRLMGTTHPDYEPTFESSGLREFQNEAVARPAAVAGDTR